MGSDTTHNRRSALRHANPTLLQAFLVQYRVIKALMMREIHTRYGRENIGFLWVIGEPILFCAGVAIVWTAIRPSHEHGLPMTAMVVTGYIPLTMYRHTMARSIKAYAVNSTLLFHRLVTPLDIIIARTILEIFGTILAGVIVLFGCISLGYMEQPQDWGLIFLSTGLTIYFCLAFSMIIAALTERSDLLEKAMGIFSYLSLPFTGAFVMVEWVPPHYRWILQLSPLSNCIEMLRTGQFGIHVVTYYSVSYILTSCTILMIIGLYMTKNIRPHIDLV